MKNKGKGTILLLSIITIILHLINRFEHSRSTSNKYLSKKISCFYEWRFGKIHYIKYGTGTPILLLHNFTIGSSSYEFHKLVHSLSKNHEVYCLDFLGYGLSDKPNMTYTNYLYVQLLTDFINNIIKRKTDIIASGDSFGVALITCHSNTELIQNIIAINPQDLYQCNIIPSKQTKILKLLLETPVLGSFIYNLYASKELITKFLKEEGFYNSSKLKEIDILTYYESAHIGKYMSKFSYASYLGQYMNCNFIHALKEINNSIYIIEGKNNKNSTTILKNYLYFNNSIETILINDSKQLPHLENPSEIVNHILTFIS